MGTSEVVSWSTQSSITLPVWNTLIFYCRAQEGLSSAEWESVTCNPAKQQLLFRKWTPPVETGPLKSPLSLCKHYLKTPLCSCEMISYQFDVSHLSRRPVHKGTAHNIDESVVPKPSQHQDLLFSSIQKGTFLSILMIWSQNRRQKTTNSIPESHRSCWTLVAIKFLSRRA